jgi:hypothetical protein
MKYFDRWYYRAREGTILYGWACFCLSYKMWRFLIFYSDKYGPRDVEWARVSFFESLGPSSISDDFIRDTHLRLQ